jgi:hypothetical protein
MTLPATQPAALNGDVLPPRRKPLPETPYRIDGGKLVRERAGARTVVQMSNQQIKWATSEWVSEDFLKSMAHTRNQEKRAPLGDKHGAWQKVAEFPLNWFMNKLPTDAWEDMKAISKIANDGDNRAFRADGNHRRI